MSTDVRCSSYKKQMTKLNDEQRKENSAARTADTEPKPEVNPLAYFYIGGGEILGDIISPIVPLEDYEALK